MKLKIMTFNLKNYISFKSNKDHWNNRKEEIIRIINSENPDIIGVQELGYKFKKILERKLDNYLFYGKGRYNINNFFEEYNCILIKKVLNFEIKSNTYSLSRSINKIGSKFKKFIFPRICTTLNLKINNNNITIMNTHLEHKRNEVKKLQLSAITEIIKLCSETNLILLGDFNMTIENINFEKFLTENKLESLSTKILPKTFIESNHKHPIDHIIVNDRIKEIRTYIYNEENYKASDHYPLISVVEIKK